METIGKRIKNSRENAHLSQNDLALQIGVKSGAVISNWENDINKPDAEKIVLLCKTLNISASYLLNYNANVEKSFKPKENNIIKKYRNLDDYGRNVVNSVINSEYKRCKETGVFR